MRRDAEKQFCGEGLGDFGTVTINEIVPFLTDMFNMMRMDLLESGIKASELVTNTGEITNQQQIIIQENNKTKNKEMLQE